MPVDSVKAPRLRNTDPIERDMADVDVIIDISQGLIPRPESGTDLDLQNKVFANPRRCHTETNADTWRRHRTEGVKRSNVLREISLKQNRRQGELDLVVGSREFSPLDDVTRAEAPFFLSACPTSHWAG